MRQAFFLFVMFHSGVSAQLLTNNGAIISSTIGAAVIVHGSVLNQGATGTLDNNGTITLTGDFTHNAPNSGFGASQGTVVLNSAVQTIGGTSVVVFNNLTLAGSGPKIMQQDMEVGGNYLSPAGLLQLNDRQLDLNTYQLTMRNAAPTAITRTTGYIVSETDPVTGYSFVQWNIGQAPAASAYTIPFGNAATGEYLPFRATLSTPGAGIAGCLRMATYATDPLAAPNNRPLPAGMPSLIDFSGLENAPHVLDRWWVMENGGYSTAPVATALFTYRDSEWSTGTNTIVEGALQLERQMGPWSMMPTATNTTSNTLTTVGQPLVPSFWTAAEFGSPLPVELLYFDVQPKGHDVLCTWSTATEVNNDFFTVERSADAESFSPIGDVDGAGDSQTILRYSFTDEEPLSGLSYYRLRQTDFDGTETRSAIVPVWFETPGNELVVYPNPCNAEIFIAGALAGEQAFVLDATGRVVMDLGVLVSGNVHVSALPSGSYSLRMMNASGSRTTCFMKH